MATTVYEVEGMTCEHCVAAMTAGFAKVAGVDGVQIDLAGRRMTLSWTLEPALAAAEPAGIVDRAGDSALAVPRP